MRYTLGISALMLVVCLGQAYSQDDMTNKMMELAQPGPEHELLNEFTGDGSMTSEMVMDPSGSSMKGTADASGELILGGRFVKLTSKGNYEMMGNKMPMETFHIIGFDRIKNVYFMFGIDTWGTYSIFAEGTYDEETQVLSLEGETEMPGMGAHKFAINYDLSPEDAYTFEVKGPAGPQSEELTTWVRGEVNTK